jgi:hypothetical protein
MAQVRHYQVSRPADVSRDKMGRLADLHFLAEDGTAIILTMRTKLLENLLVDIERVLADKPKPDQRR